MKKMAVLTALVVFGALFFNLNGAAAFPALPGDLNMAQPDPSLPKELTDFLGKWEGSLNVPGRVIRLALIVEKIDFTSAQLYLFTAAGNWERVTGEVTKEYGKYRIYFRGKDGQSVLSLRKGGKYLDLSLQSSLQSFTGIFTRP